ncbi:MAG: hypothetical protein SGJ23_06495 [Alphaproteobacteria bacterium]|nr:hypothetical protein [Alphaproteobacteria bacterium]
MLRFLSLATLSQVAVAVTQLFMLPLQIHAWGHDVVAIWLVGAASAAILNVADLGLRNAGYAALMARDSYFATVWSVMRTQIAVLAVAIAAGLVLTHMGKTGPETWLFLVLLVAASAAENTFYLRGTFMESRGLILTSEILFLGFALIRLVLGGLLLLVFHIGPLALAILWCVTSYGVLFLQGRVAAFRDVAPLAGGWSFAEWKRAYGDAKWAASTPLVTWAQMNLPVLALSTFAPAIAVSGYVAIRTLFGLVRTIFVQFGRLASVAYVKRAVNGHVAEARGVVLAAASVAGWVGAGVGLAVFAENFWITGRLFDLAGNERDRLFALALAVSAVLSVHQLFNLSLAREGAFSVVGRANYAYVAAMIVVCLLAATFTDTMIVAVGLIITDALLLVMSAWIFVRGDKRETPVGFRYIFLGSMTAWVLLLLGGWRVFMFVGDEAHARTLLAVFLALTAAGVLWLSAGAVFWWRARGEIRTLTSPAIKPA